MDNHGHPELERMRELQLDLSGVRTLPSYAVQDPETLEVLTTFTYIDFKGDGRAFLEVLQKRDESAAVDPGG